MSLLREPRLRQPDRILTATRLQGTDAHRQRPCARDAGCSDSSVPPRSPRASPRARIRTVEFLAAIVGAVLIALVAWDLFQTVVVPRPTPGRFRVARYVVTGSWAGVKGLGRRAPASIRDTLYGLYGPGTAILLLAVWLALLIAGFGFLMYALRDQLTPAPADLGSAIYFAATSVLTIG